MKRHKRPVGDRVAQSTGEADEHADRLSGVRPVVHEEDARPSREDRDYGSTIFTRRPVPLPRFLGGAKKKRP
jgi:hypothetical protein